jgi:hypothetical protein
MQIRWAKIGEEEQLANSLRKQLMNCVGWDGDELASSREEAYNYYFQRKRGDEITGRSQIVTGDLSSMVEGNLAQMVGPLIDKRIAEFCAYDAADEEQAQLESDCVSEMLFKRQNGFIEVAAAIKDILLVRNGVVKVYVDERTHKSRVRRGNVAPEIVTDVLDQIGETKVHKYDPETKELDATVTKTTRKFRVESLVPENFLVPRNWNRQDLEDIPFCAERHIEPRATLVERGFDKSKVYKLRRYTAVNVAGGDARLPRQLSSPVLNPFDKSQELVEWYECYCKIEASDGTSELHRYCVSEKFVLEDEIIESTVISYALGVAIINPHTFIGISLHDKLKSTQDSTTALTRALMDNLNATSKARTAHFDEIVEEQDLTDGRINNSIRVKPGMVGDVRQAITAFQVPDTSGNILQNLEAFKRTRSEMGGATLDMATGQVQLNDRVGSAGLDRAYSVMERLAEFMTRTVAHTLVRNMYLIAHETLRTQWNGSISFKRGKEWIQQDPAKWKVREGVTVNMGASPGERARIAGVLERMLDKQVALAQHGMEDILVDSTGFFTGMMEWLRISDIPNPERFFLDPRSDKSQQAFKRKAIGQQKQAAKQEALMNNAIALEQLRTALDKYKHDSEIQFKYYSEVLGAQIEEAKLAVSGIVDLVGVKQKAREAKQNANAGSTDKGSTKGTSKPAKGKPSTGADSGNAGTGSNPSVESGAES